MSTEKPAAAKVAGRVVTCPRCGQPAIYAPSNPARPFCSMRCKNADFGAWANEEYRVPDETAPVGDADEPT